MWQWEGGEPRRLRVSPEKKGLSGLDLPVEEEEEEKEGGVAVAAVVVAEEEEEQQQQQQ